MYKLYTVGVCPWSSLLSKVRSKLFIPQKHFLLGAHCYLFRDFFTCFWFLELLICFSNFHLFCSIIVFLTFMSLFSLHCKSPFLVLLVNLVSRAAPVSYCFKLSLNLLSFPVSQRYQCIEPFKSFWRSLCSSNSLGPTALLYILIIVQEKQSNADSFSCLLVFHPCVCLLALGHILLYLFIFN